MVLGMSSAETNLKITLLAVLVRGQDGGGGEVSVLSVFQRYPTALPEAQDAPPVSAPGLKPPGRNRRQSRPRFPPSSAVKLDLFPGITCSTLKKIFTEFIFTSRPPSSPGALPLPPSCSLSIPPPAACAPTMPAFVRGTMFALPRGWGDWK